ncbi:MAG: LytTR family DNA-binding domain-containing protein [Spirosomataceae bacterium]
MQHLLAPPPASALQILRNKVAIPFQDLLRIEGRGNYTEFFLQNGKKVLTSKTLSFYEPLLPSFFLKVNKGCIINCHYLIITQSRKIGALQMTDGTKVEVARRKKASVKMICEQIRRQQR